jgi:sulfur-carrier protein
MITVKFFASLREQIGHGETAISLPSPPTVASIWAQVSGQANWGDGVLAAVNHDYVERDHEVCDGDEVAFFPPVTGG